MKAFPGKLFFLSPDRLALLLNLLFYKGIRLMVEKYNIRKSKVINPKN
jgi:hypothetical protein